MEITNTNANDYINSVIDSIDNNNNNNDDNNNNNNNSNVTELEGQFVLRMPANKDGTLHPVTKKLREALNNGTNNLNERLFIDLNTETRKARVKFDDDLFKANLVDLPCIIESLKTVDKRTFYKTADICQMLLCKQISDDTNDSKSDSESEYEQKSQRFNGSFQDVNKKYQWLHGIAPPLKNARRKRFRKVAKKKIVDYVEIEKEVKRLFRADRDAIKVEYEILYVDEPQVTNEDENNDELSKNLRNKKNKQDLIDSISIDESTLNNIELTNSPMCIHADSSNDAIINRKQMSNSKRYFMEEVIGDVSSSSESDAESENADLEMKSKLSRNTSFNQNTQNTSFELMFIGDESTNLDAPHIRANNMQQMYSEDSNTNIFDENSNTPIDTMKIFGDDADNLSSTDSSDSFETNLSQSSSNNLNKNEMNKKLEKLLDELDQIQAQRKRQQDEINQINNPVLKSRLLPLLNELIEEEKLKSSEIEHLKATLLS